MSQSMVKIKKETDSKSHCFCLTCLRLLLCTSTVSEFISSESIINQPCCVSRTGAFLLSSRTATHALRAISGLMMSACDRRAPLTKALLISLAPTLWPQCATHVHSNQNFKGTRSTSQSPTEMHCMILNLDARMH